MKDTVRPLGKSITDDHKNSCAHVSEDIIRYYSEAGIDYEPWSENYNMHFGYFRKGVNPLKREQLLAEMNAQVLQRLHINNYPLAQIIDLGCGVGATARYCAQHFSNTLITGATVVPWQIEKAQSLTEQIGLSQRVSFNLIDYRNTPFEENTFEGAYAIESSCYADGTSKKLFLNESFRILKPGARLVVADGFRKRKKGSTLFEKAFQMVCDGWSLDTFAHIDHFTQAMAEAGFDDIKVEEASWRVLPSVLHVPWVSLCYFAKNILFRRGHRRVQKDHLMAPLMGIILGMHRRGFGYYLISARKPES